MPTKDSTSAWKPVAEDTSAWKPVANASPTPKPAAAAAPTGNTYLRNLMDGLTGNNGLGQFLVGAGKGAVGTAANVSGMIDSGSRHLLPNLPQPTSVNAAKQWAEPKPGTAQVAGKTAEQIGEFFVPAVGEEAAIAKLGGSAAAKLGVKALASGAVNKAQGGSFGAGAAAGAVGEGVAQGAKAIAPELAEIGLRVRGANRGFGADPGDFILNHTQGITPESVLKSGQQTLQDLGQQKSAILANAPDVDLTPARNVGKGFVDKAARQGHVETKDAVQRVASQLDDDLTTGSKLRPIVPAARAGDLQRGLGEATSWNPTMNSDTLTQAGRQMYSTLGQSIEQVAPDVAPINATIHSGLPVIERAKATSLMAGVPERLAHKMGVHTGALAGSLFGYHTAGLPGAVAGFLGPELLSSPPTYLGLARAANSPMLRPLLPALEGAALQPFRKKDE